MENVLTRLASIPFEAVVVIVCFLTLSTAVISVCVMLLKSRVSQLKKSLTTTDSLVLTLTTEAEAQAMLVRQLSMDLQDFRQQLAERELVRSQPDLPVWTSANLPINLNRRGQILSLSRKGKSVGEIAQDLNVAQGEVELLLKVHDLSQKIPVHEN